MTLRKKTLLIIALTLIGLMIVLYFISQRILVSDYERLEQDRVQHEVNRVLNALDYQLKSLRTTVADYAWWDDTYQFIVDRNEQYIADNMSDVILQVEDINLALYVNNSSDIIFSRAIESVTAREVSQELELIAFLKADSPLLHIEGDLESKSGIMFVANRPVLIASLKILDDYAKGPGRGFLMFGQFLDDFRIGKLSESLGMPIRIYAANSPDLPSDFRGARVNLSLDAPPFVSTLDGDTIGGYALLHDIFDNPGIILRIELPRAIYKQGQTTLSYFTLTLISLGAVFGLVVLLLLERNVLIRITSLSREVLHFGSTNDLSARVKVTGRDELSSLTLSVNSMLESIEHAQHKQQQLNHDLQKSLEELADLQSHKDRFFSHAAHEFRTPLTSFRTYLYLLGKRPDRYSEYLPVLEKATAQLGKLLDDILDLARYGRHEVQVNKQSVDFYDLIDAVVDRQADRTNDLKFIVLPAGQNNPLYCKLDSRQMTLAIDRILAHLINATPPGGTIAFEVTSAPETITLCLSSDKMQIDTFQASSLFQPFSVASEGGRPTTGLGLTIAKEIVELHEGQIRFEQTGTGNAAFKIFLPLETEYLTRELSTALI